jgi:hypothetical protein
MDGAYQPAAWHDLYLMAGGAAAGLTGLIFVAVSLHLREVLGDRWHRGTAGSSLLALMSVVLISGALLIPDQPLALLGAEIALIAAASFAYNAIALAHLPSTNRQGALVQILAGLSGGALAIGSGLSLALRIGGGLWLLVPAAAIALASSVANAWRLMVDVAATSGALDASDASSSSPIVQRGATVGSHHRDAGSGSRPEASVRS